MNILRTVTLDRINRKKDKSVSLTFITTTEQTSEQFMELDKELDQSGVLFFKTNGLLTDKEQQAIEVSDIKNDNKSQSQKIRQRIWVLWKQSKSEMSESDFYKHTTERLLTSLDKEIDKFR
jgi:hypothetical protein